MTQLLDILHVMTGKQRDNVVFFIVDAQKLTHPFLAHYIQSDCGFIEKKHAGLMNERSDQFHFHSLA